MVTERVTSPRWGRAPGTAALGLALDAVVGDPRDRWHPVAWFGALASTLERRLWADRQGPGAVLAGAGVGVGAAAGLLAQRTVGPAAACATATAVAAGGRSLATVAREIAACLERGDLDHARARLPALAGRDPSGLDEKEIARAVVESVAENTVDAVVAPALWAAAASAPGVLGYRAVNTLDAMVGHRSPRHARFGWASARLDDGANWVPARVTAIAVGAVRPARARAVLEAVRSQAPVHPSPNAGVAEAAFAAALGVTLGGVNRYGDRVEVRPPLGAGPPPGTGDVERAVRLSSDVRWALAGALGALGALRAGRARRIRRTSPIHPPSRRSPSRP